MIKRTCDVCHGHQVIRLPIISPMPRDIHSGAVASESITGHSRTYPCPECAPVMPLERFIALSATVDISFDWAGAEAKGADLAKGEAADILAEGMLKRGLIGMREEPSSPGSAKKSILATLVIAPPGRGDAIKEAQKMQRAALVKRVHDIVLDTLPVGGEVRLGDLYKAFDVAMATVMRDHAAPADGEKQHSGVV